ncbi:hypothetical protein R75461_05897 [Paraburkholderia nemoris]|uniref:TRAFAC clade GTPase domain-containing protein n=1 Tax=Paraburkholderia nemoris TaxID=2793076 RepID=UPI00190AE3A7|nr:MULTISPECIES: hypothetical protein [Paraburkholderia]MBK3786146.1 hypothetical protein [Paraburkholderia aspalathi]CAE6816530.1 hypothetical protein R75461_05897 [Paraburkholderia nemoris]
MTRKLVIAGMPDSGKSTFLIALRHLLVSHEVQSVLRATRLSDAEKHLNGLAEKWLACEQVDRTQTGVEEWVSLHVRKEADSSEAEIVVPDFSGEAFRRPAATGNCSSGIARMLFELDGLLLFTNADRSADDVRLEALASLFAVPSEAEGSGTDGTNAKPSRSESGTEPESGDANPVMQPAMADPAGVANSAPAYSAAPFDPVNMPEEALLVELLQILNRRPRVPTARAIAVIVSAWDVVEEQDVSPEQWLEQHRPMVWQYLRNNDDLWSIRVYGVSAQGGKLPDEQKALQAKIPGERVQIVGHGAQPHDLTAPIDWLMTGGVVEDHA